MDLHQPAENSAMSAYKPSYKDMLANAYNNWSGKPTMAVVYPRITLDKYDFQHLRDNGFELVAVEDLKIEDLRAAMEDYYATTDWSCFKRADWEEAMATLV